MERQLEQLKEFHTTFKQHIGEKPSFPPDNVIQLRLSLILEELTELARACGHQNYEAFRSMLEKKVDEVHFDAERSREHLKRDLVEVLDSLAGDLPYVLFGTILAFGLQDIAVEVHDEVHRSNMTKACKSYKEANETRDYHQTKSDSLCHIEEEAEGGKCLVFRSSDRKLMKSINYSPVNLKRFLDEVPATNISEESPGKE